MKGVLFTELLGFAQDRWGGDTADRLVKFQSRAAGETYDPLARYDAGELLRLVAALAAYTGTIEGDLLRTFGEHLFARFAALYPVFFVGVDSASSFLSRLETHVHAEVRKLEPTSELPTFAVQRSAPGVLEIDYASPRPLADLAEGLIRGCIAHFGEPLGVERRDDPAAPRRRVRFTLRRLAA